MKRVMIAMAAVWVGCAAEKSSEPASTTPATTQTATPAAQPVAANSPPPPPMIGGKGGPGMDGIGPAGGGAPPTGASTGDEDPCAGGRIVQSSGSPEISGSLDRDAVRDVVKRNGAALRKCVSAAASKGPLTTKRLTVRFVIGTTGDVTDAKADGAADELSDCVLKVFRGMHFTPSGSPVSVSYPLVLQAN